MIDRFSFSVIHTVAGRTYEASTLGALRCKRLAWCLQAGLPFRRPPQFKESHR
ncbi:TPA: hypothetical protein ACU9T0_001940 [Burkholderia cenocepacia]